MGSPAEFLQELIDCGFTFFFIAGTKAHATIDEEERMQLPTIAACTNFSEEQLLSLYSSNLRHLLETGTTKEFIASFTADALELWG